MALPKLNKNVLFIGGAILLGLMAALLSVSYVQKRVDEATNAAARPSVPETRVVVSKRDLAIGEMVGPDDFLARAVPLDFIPADAISPEEYGKFVGRLVRAPIKRGAPVSASALVPLHDRFSRVIVPGKVGYTLSVSENNSISGMIAPGDAVDILLHYEADSARQDVGERVVPLLQNIVVLATGQKIHDVVEASNAGGFSSVTLELDPEQAEKLTVGQAMGSLRVLLRNVEDGTPFGLRGLTERALEATFGQGGSDSVEYIIGGSN